MSSGSISPNSREVISARNSITGKQEYLSSTNNKLDVNATASLAGSSIPISGALTGVGVAILDSSGNQISSFGGGTQYADGVVRGTATGTLMMIDDGTNIQSAIGNSSGEQIVQAKQNSTWNITNISGTISLPTGAATAVKQDTGNTSIASLDTKTPALGQALAAASTPVVLTAAQITTLTPPAAITGFATSANQSTEITSLATIAALSKVEDAPHSSGDTGVPMWAVRNDTGAVFAGSDGDYIPFATDATGALRVDLNGTVSTNNSTTSVLAGGAVFTGTSEDVLNYNEVRISVIASHASATDGLSIQQSSDNTNWDITDTYTIAAATGKTYVVPRQARYFRVVYTNGATLQTSFRLQTILNRLGTVASSQRSSDAYTNETDLQEVWSFNSVWNSAAWDRVRSIINATNSVGTGIVAAGMVAQFDDVSPTAITENNFGNARMSANRNLYNTIRDAAGNERGANVSAGNALLVDASATTQPVSYATTGSGTATGALRVEIANNGTGVVGLNTGTNSIGKISDITTSVVPGTGATNLGKAEDAAHTTGDTGVFTLGVRNDTLADVTNTTADYSQYSTDIKGRLMTAGAPRSLKGVQQTSVSNTTSETTIVAAVGSTFLDVYGLILANTGASTTKVTIKDATAGTTRAIIEVPTLETRGFMLPVDSAIPQAAVNSNWTVTCGTATTALEVTAMYVKMV